MREYISSIAGIISVAVCFFIAAVGVINGVEPIMCCYRAVCGSIFVYCIATISLHLVARIVLAAIVESKIENEEKSEN